MKFLVLTVFASFLLAHSAPAASECAGETYSGTIVKVAIDTVGTMGGVTGGTVTFTPKNGPERSYQLKAEEIPQFYEESREVARNSENAFVFLSAYADYNYPVFIHYVGTNFEEDLLKVLHAPGRKKEPGNEMRVWKGPGYAGSEQHQFTDVVCSVLLDP